MRRDSDTLSGKVTALENRGEHGNTFSWILQHAQTMSSFEGFQCLLVQIVLGHRHLAFKQTCFGNLMFHVPIVWNLFGGPYYESRR